MLLLWSLVHRDQLNKKQRNWKRRIALFGPLFLNTSKQKTYSLFRTNYLTPNIILVSDSPPRIGEIFTQITEPRADIVLYHIASTFQLNCNKPASESHNL